MSMFKFDVWEMFLPKADKYGVALGKQLPGFVAKLKGLAKKHGYDWEPSLPEELKPLLGEIAEALAGGLKIERSQVKIGGKLGDELTEYANEFINAVGLGASEALSDDGTSRKPDAKGKSVQDPNDPLDRLGFVTETIVRGIAYPLWNYAKCIHPSVKRPFAPRGGATKADITMRTAIGLNCLINDCGCSGTPEQIAALIAQVNAPIASTPKPTAPASKPDPKSVPKSDTPEIPMSEQKSVRADHTVLDLWEQVRQKDVELHDAQRDQFVQMTETHPELLQLTIEAFHGSGTFEQFYSIFFLTPHKDWVHALKLLLGQTKKPESNFDRERRETQAAIQAITKWMKGSSPKLDAVIAKQELVKAALDAEIAGDTKLAKQIRARIKALGK